MLYLPVKIIEQLSHHQPNPIETLGENHKDLASGAALHPTVLKC
jgi:hypothetical protein